MSGTCSILGCRRPPRDRRRRAVYARGDGRNALLTTNWRQRPCRMMPCARSCPRPEFPPDRAATVDIARGADPVLPTPFRIGTAGTATLAATGLAAADLWELRTGRRQIVTVDFRHATASLRSGHYMKLGDGEVSTRRNAIMGVYPTKDGRWSYIHANFPNHRAAALSVLGVAEDRDAVAKAVLTWNAADLEEAIIAAKGAGGMVRTKAEWAQHPQAAAIASLPLLEIVKIGDSKPEPLPPGTDRCPASACST